MSKKKVGIISDDDKQFHSIAEQLVKQIKIRDKKIKELEDKPDR
jgi:hypothetical protein